MLGTTCVKVLNALYRAARAKGRDLTIVETGSGVQSTVALAQWAAKQPSKVAFYSIDVDGDHQDTCKKKLQELGVSDYVNFIAGDSEAMLDSMPDNFFDFALLDACTGLDALKEWLVVRNKMRAPGVVLLAQAFHPTGGDVLAAAYRSGHTITEFNRQSIAISFAADEVVKEARG